MNEWIIFPENYTKTEIEWIEKKRSENTAKV